MDDDTNEFNDSSLKLKEEDSTYIHSVSVFEVDGAKDKLYC